jgi:uncharacterized protein with NRDE domain
VGIEWERRLSSALITGADYGTRASTVVAVGEAGAIAFEERTIAADGTVALNRREKLQVETS